MATASEWTEVIRAVFAGLKDLILACAAVGTIWIQAQNSGKLDVAAAKTEMVKESLEASSKISDQKLDVIAKAQTAAKAEGP